MNSRRVIYLSDISLTEACERWRSALAASGLLTALAGAPIDVETSAGRVTASPVFAEKSSPLHHCAAMDGYAVRFAETFGASEASPKRLLIGEQAVVVDTGEPVPGDFDAVIMVEDVEPVSHEEIEIIAPATPWQHIRPMGEDIVATELILPENQVIRPVDIAAMTAAGVLRVPVRRRPIVSVIPTGSELVPPGAEAPAGGIIEFNSRLLAGMAEQWGAETQRHEIVADDFERISQAVKTAAAASDLVIVNAGSSAGSHDYTVHVVGELGKVLVHGVRIKPGKPVVLGIVDNTPVIGIPGYPVSAALDMELFAAPVIHELQGRSAPERQRVPVRVPRKIASAIGSEEFVRVKLGRVAGRLVATPIQRGAGALMSLVRADGLLRIPEDSEGVRAGESVEIELLRPLEEVEQTIVAVGSHDISLDILASELKSRHPGMTLSSAHVGSMAGIMALKREEAHLAGIHLLDEQTGEYNSSYIKRYLPDHQICLVNLAYRQQGIIVARGNPKSIASLADLTRKDVIFMNRQRGAGTRILLDFLLAGQNLHPEEIRGYDREEYTHTAVAAAVADGTADAALGIMAAARALDLGFVPLATERYDLAVPLASLSEPPIQALLEVLRSERFRERVSSLGGYDMSHTAEVIC